MITFTGIIFSAVFVAAQIQTSSYSPRLAARLRRDPVVIAGLALPTATAIYSLFALAAIGRPERASPAATSCPTATVIFGLRARVVTLGTFVALVQRAFESTQIGGIFRALMRRGYAVIEDVHPLDAPGTTPTPPRRSRTRRDSKSRTRGRPPSSPRSTAPRCCGSRGQTGGFVDVVPVVGEYLAPGAGSCCAITGGRADAGSGARPRRVFVLARQRTIDQDPAFALRMLVDIAIRALSPAINDPTTAVQALDRIEALLVELVPAPPRTVGRRATTTGRRAGSSPRPRGPRTWSSG